jgi:hypothetical protein
MFKSCKLIPVMLVGVVFLGKKYSWMDYLAMLSLTIGMVIFSVGDSLVNTQFSTPGLVAIGFALMADALIGNVQEKSMNKYNASTTEMIFYSKGIGSVFLLIALVVTGELVPAFLYCWERPIVYLYFFVRDFPPPLSVLGVNCSARLVSPFCFSLNLTVPSKIVHTRFAGFCLPRLLWRVLCHGARQAVWRTGRGDRHVESQAHVDHGLLFALSKAIHIHLPHRHGASVFRHWTRGLFEELKGNQSVGRTIAHARHSQLLHSNRARRGTSVSKQPSL